MILRRAPFMDKAKGPFMRKQPLGLVTKVVANYLSEAFKWPPRSPKWFIARGTKRLVELFRMGSDDLAYFLYFSFSALRIA
jgi:hypothetical protein